MSEATETGGFVEPAAGTGPGESAGPTGSAGRPGRTGTEDAGDDLRQPPLQYRFDGPEQAPVLVLGPALGATWHMWDRQLPQLSDAWRVLRYELPGHGGAAGARAEQPAAHGGHQGDRP